MVNGNKKWCFTVNNFTTDRVDLLVSLFPDHVKYLVFGYETGTSGTPHLQGFVWLLQTKSLSQTVSLLGGVGIHLVVARGNPKQASDYCKKDGHFEEFGVLTTDAGKRNDWHQLKDWLKTCTVRPTVSELAEDYPHLMARYRSSVYYMVELFCPPPVFAEGELRDWQKSLSTLLAVPPDDRKVLFVVDPDGNRGKSWFQKKFHLAAPTKVQLLMMGKRDDMAYAINEERNVFFINVPRGSMEFLQYSILEMLKDGVVHSPKYESRTKFLSTPHVVVFCNEYPDMNKMTADRYDFFTGFQTDLVL